MTSWRQKFLLRFLVGIFLAQMITFGTVMWACWVEGGTKICPRIGNVFEEMFGLWVSVVLALLTGVALNVADEGKKRE